MHVVGVIAVLEGNVAATCVVDVLVVGVDGVGGWCGWSWVNSFLVEGLLHSAAQCCIVLHSAAHFQNTFIKQRFQLSFNKRDKSIACFWRGGASLDVCDVQNP
ncbi:MAG TPA: hypothetical protein DEV68_03285 [Corynebacterium flavescens]|nr:hypothetical protein [Corynebacterium flavescens]